MIPTRRSLCVLILVSAVSASGPSPFRGAGGD